MRARFVNEHMNFEKKKDPLSSLSVGKIHLITIWLDDMNIKNYELNDDLSIDVYDVVNLSFKKLIKIPTYIKFNIVTRSFYCDHNQLTSLDGCPKFIDRDFWCNDNQLINLNGSPSEVTGAFHCYNNVRQFTEDVVLQYCKCNRDLISIF
jgi:hypothetical protein